MGFLIGTPLFLPSFLFVLGGVLVYAILNDLVLIRFVFGMQGLCWWELEVSGDQHSRLTAVKTELRSYKIERDI